MPTVIIPPPYQGPTRAVGRVEVAAGSVRDCLDELEARFPGFRAQVMAGRRRASLREALRERRAPARDRTSSESSQARDELEIVAAIAGG